MKIVLSLASAIVAVFVWASVAFAAPEGRYTVIGTNPGGTGQYTGTVNVVAKGNAYDVVWKIGNSRFTGIGVFTEAGLSIAYYGANLTGVAVYREHPDGSWKGVWATKGSGRLGNEEWTPR